MSPKSREQSLELRRESHEPENTTIQHSPSNARRSTRHGTRLTLAHPSDSWIDISSVDTSATATFSTHNPVNSSSPLTDPVRANRTNFVSHTKSSRSPEIVPSADTSSQDEYEESESESDHITTSSTEAIEALARNTPYQRATNSTDELVDGRACFTPQPNAFSHPPLDRSHKSGLEPDSYFPSMESNDRHSESATNQIPATKKLADQAQNEAVLRASLTTLLSCAAAARGLPKNSQTMVRQEHVSSRVRPGSLRLVREPPTGAAESSSSGGQFENTSESQSPPAPKKDKRRLAATTGRDRHSSKRLKSVPADELVKPTVLTWLVSAGILVVVSALSFSAGFHAGRRTSLLEAQSEMPGMTRFSPEYSRQESRGGIGLRKRLLSSMVTAAA